MGDTIDRHTPGRDRAQADRVAAFNAERPIPVLGIRLPQPREPFLARLWDRAMSP